jgi:hypothetical protein
MDDAPQVAAGYDQPERERLHGEVEVDETWNLSVLLPKRVLDLYSEWIFDQQKLWFDRRG